MFQAGVGDRLPGGGILFCVPDNDGFVVWLQGEHDASNVSALTQMLSRAIASEYQTVIVDLSGVEFVGAATVGVIIAARERLRLSSRNLAIRAPSHCALRILDLCGFSEFLDGEPTEVTRPTGPAGALATWVEVPVLPRMDRRDVATKDPPNTSTEAEPPEPESVLCEPRATVAGPGGS